MKWHNHLVKDVALVVAYFEGHQFLKMVKNQFFVNKIKTFIYR